jgi:serine/threonine-protein kinase
MKACSACGRLYPDDSGFCPVDGQALVSATQAPVAGSDDDARIGQILCTRYQVRRVVADGGMGRVYEALDVVDRGNVALKILHPDVAQDEVSVQRFRREFEVSKLLPHDHIVDVRDFQATHDGSFALAMEFLYGEELRNTLKREEVIPPARVVRMLSQIALALDEAHQRKLVHRDLKPDNIFLCQTREGDIVKILDFGSVKDKGESAKKLTVMGTTIGSPYYMAPEQAQGLDTLDHRADVWSLAAIAYECVSGKVPFQGSNGPSILLEILTKEPAPVSKAAHERKYPVPPTLDRVMVHAFKKNASMRIGSVGALADAVGGAYGLSGTHFDWAKTNEAELAAAIDAEMPTLMLADGRPTSADAFADGFFGETSSLDAPDPFGSTQPPPQFMGGSAPGGQPMAYGGAQDDLVPMGIPKSNVLLFVAIAAGAFFFVIGVIVVVWVF